MAPHVQMNGAETPTEQPLPPIGVPVDFEVTGVEAKESKNTGKPMVAVQMRVIGTEAEGDQMFDYFVEPNTNRRTQIALKRFAAAVGVDIGEEGFDTEELLGCKGQFVLKKDMYEGRERRRIADYVLS